MTRRKLLALIACIPVAPFVGWWTARKNKTEPDCFLTQIANQGTPGEQTTVYSILTTKKEAVFIHE